MKRIIVTGCYGQLGKEINRLYEGNRDIELINTDVDELDISNVNAVINFAKRAEPYAIISGKVLAQVVAAVAQILIWVSSIVLGVCFGHYLALFINPEFKDGLFAVIDQLKEQNLASAFSPAAVAIALIYAIVGFVFYCAIASLVGANV